jgi:transcriptional antiterminator NusG
MSEVHTPPTATTPPAEPKTEVPADPHVPADPTAHAAHAGAVSEAQASVEHATEPDPLHAPEPAPAPPPEFAEVVAATGESPVAEPALEAETPEHAPVPETEALVPVPEPVSEELVPVHEPSAPAETLAEVAPVVAEPAPTAEEPKGEEAPAEEEPKAKPKRTRTAKAPKAPTAAATTAPAPTGTVTPTEAPTEPKPESKKKWYAIKVQSGREDTIKSAILRKVAIEGLEEYFGQIVIPVEEEVVKKTVRVKDKKTGEYTTQEKKVTRKKKKFQGYLFAELEFNDRILYLFRETSGVGDFLNLRGTPPVPEPMPDHEVQSMLTGVSVKGPLGKGGTKKVKLEFEKGDRVRVREGSFANQEGEVKSITEPKDPTDTPKVKVELTFWGRPLEVDLDYWQVEKV